MPLLLSDGELSGRGRREWTQTEARHSRVALRPHALSACRFLAAIMGISQSELLRRAIDRILADGWILVRIRASHHHYKHRSKTGLVTIPHPRKDLGTGVFRNILRQAELL